jgi:hypothetical protein
MCFRIHRFKVTTHVTKVIRGICVYRESEYLTWYGEWLRTERLVFDSRRGQIFSLLIFTQLPSLFYISLSHRLPRIYPLSFSSSLRLHYSAFLRSSSVRRHALYSWPGRSSVTPSLPHSHGIYCPMKKSVLVLLSS